MIFWVRFVSRVVIEWFPLKSCWEGDSGRCSLILFKISFSSTYDTVVSKDMDRYDAGFFGDFLVFRMGMMLAGFQMGRLSLCNHEWLKSSLRAWVAKGPRCLR